MKKTTAQIIRDELKKAELIGLPSKVDKLATKMDEMADAAKIIRENEQNLKDLGGLKHRLDTLDKIMVTVDKIAGGIQTYQQEQTLNSNKLSKHSDRLEIIEKHLNITATT